MNRLFCFGLGYSATALARRLAAKGWAVQGTARSAEGARRIKAMGYDGFVFDGVQRDSGVSVALREATHVLVSVPPEATGDPVLRHHGSDIATAPGVRWIGYLSTIGVYGDRQGGWVDETSPPAPISERSRNRLAAERHWETLGATSGKRIHIFRLSGIYGPGRSAIDSLRAGTARSIVRPGQVFNRIHVEDIAATLEAAIATDGRHVVYNVTDDEPASPEAVMAEAARLLEVNPPPSVPVAEARLSGMAASFYAENKRVRNDRIKTDLGLRLDYPTYREGLAAIARSTS